jgi:hypothetical protein
LASICPAWRSLGVGNSIALKPEANGMDYNQDKVDEITLALLWLTTFKSGG